MKKLAPAIRTVWTIHYAVGTALLVLASAAFELTRLFAEGDRAVPPGVITLVLLAVGLALTFGIPRLRYRYWRYALREEELYVERGIWNRIRTIVPLRRIQHLDVSQNILEREHDLGKLIVHTAGSQSSDVVVVGLPLDEAEQLRDVMQRYILDDAV
jgi:membrane protein YdbS with pleckstrin-like domain